MTPSVVSKIREDYHSELKNHNELRILLTPKEVTEILNMVLDLPDHDVVSIKSNQNKIEFVIKKSK